MLPASVQVCPVEIPGRGRREGEPAIPHVKQLAALLARSLPLADKPYAIFGTCLGAIVGYELVREVERSGCAPLPAAFMPAAVSPPHLYALAVMKLYLRRRVGKEGWWWWWCGWWWGGGRLGGVTRRVQARHCTQDLRSHWHPQATPSHRAPHPCPSLLVGPTCACRFSYFARRPARGAAGGRGDGHPARLAGAAQGRAAQGL